MESYFVISNSEGNTRVEQLTKTELLSRIDPEDPYYGSAVSFLKEIGNKDTNYWHGNILIIKGSIIVPEERQVVTEYHIP